MINGIEIVSFALLVITELNGTVATAFISPSVSYSLGDINGHKRFHYNTGHDRTKYNYKANGALFEKDRRREQGYRRKRKGADVEVDSDSSSGLKDTALITRKSYRKSTNINEIDIVSNTESRNDLVTSSSSIAQQTRVNNTYSDIDGKELSSLNKGAMEPQKTLTMETLTGGPSLIFAMARRMLFWDDDNDESDGSYQQGKRDNSSNKSRSKNKNKNNKSLPKPRRIPRPKEKIVPRWHPYDGIADANPSFRMEPPAMNNRGYASIIRRNSRKRGKVSLWRHALRMYDKMKAEELEQQHQIQTKQRHPSTATILRTTEHFEAASVAYAKLGLWREVLGIYREIVEKSTIGGRDDLAITDNLILSIVRACVRAAKMRKKQKFNEKEQRAPLDAVKDILDGLEVNHGISLESRHINPLAAAYQYLGLTVESSDVVRTFLVDRLTRAPINIDDNDTTNDHEAVAIVETRLKDKASYNILVQGAIIEGNWTTAIDSLRNMTEAGLYPNSRNLNVWSETAKKRELRGGGRRMRSWKKKRERMLVRGTLPQVGPVRHNMPRGP